jgi:Kdo2-lipid IVA lauroyltransferase/acyltransferase
MRTFITKLIGLPFFLGSFLPMRILFILSDFACFLIYDVFRYRREVVHQNLIESFPDFSDDEIHRVEKEFYHHFCDIFFETIKALTISRREIIRRFQIKNPELLERYFSNNRSIILYMAHYANWEWMLFLPGFTRFQVLAFYQPLSSSYFDELVKLSRERCGVKVVESSKGFKTVRDYTRQGIPTISYLIGDQSPVKGSSMHWIDFMNRKTAFLAGSDRIAKVCDLAVVFLSMKKISRGVYEIEFVPLEDYPETSRDGEIIEKYAHALEQQIRNTPQLWLWSHRRWKLTQSETEAGKTE